MQAACCRGLYAACDSVETDSADQAITWQVVRAAVAMLDMEPHIAELAGVLLLNISAHSDRSRSLFNMLSFDSITDLIVRKQVSRSVSMNLARFLHNLICVPGQHVVPHSSQLVQDSDSEDSDIDADAQPGKTTSSGYAGYDIDDQAKVKRSNADRLRATCS